MQIYQQTLREAVFFSGVGVHSGAPSELTVRPAPAGHGIIFACKAAGCGQKRIAARSACAQPADLCTVLSEEPGAPPRAMMIEHLMAALAGMGADNALAELSAPEMPILDGSAACYVKALQKAGLVRLKAKRSYLLVKKPVRIAAARGGGYAEFLPLKTGEQPAQRFDVMIDFAARAIGCQQLRFALSPDYFAEYLAPARTFGFLRDAERLRAAGLARGASLENSVVLGEDGAALNPENLIAPDGFVRHKALDAVGDTALLGAPFIGLFRSRKSGHRLNGAAVAALLADKQAYEETEL